MYKIPYCCALGLAVFRPSAHTRKSLLHTNPLYARYLCSRDALGLRAEQPVGQARRATIGYLVYKQTLTQTKNCNLLWQCHVMSCNLSSFAYNLLENYFIMLTLRHVGDSKSAFNNTLGCALFSKFLGLNAVLVKLDELSSGVPSFLKSDHGKLLRIAILCLVTWMSRGICVMVS